MKHLDEAVEAVALRQHGAFTRKQALGEGVTASCCDRRLRAGQWLRSREPGVYLLRGHPVTWHQRLMSCVLAGPPGSVVSHRAAAALHGVREGAPVEITVPLRSYHQLTAVVHQLDVPAADRCLLQQIPATRIERTLLDLAAVANETELERAIEAALRSGLTTRERLLSNAEGAGRRWGLVRFRRVLARCSEGRPTGSELEVRFVQLLRAAGVDEPVRQYEVVVDGARYFLDFAYPAWRVAIELDGRAFHGFEEDRRRQNALVLAGWTVLRFTWVDVTEREAATVAAVTQGLRAA